MRYPFFISLILFMSSVSASADIYYLVDDNGVVNVTNHPAQEEYHLLLKERPRSRPHFSGNDASRDRGGNPNLYSQHINIAAQRTGLDSRLLHALIMVESNYNADAISPKGACGLMQLMPQTARRYGVKNIFDPAQNLDAGAQYLTDLLRMFNNNLELAVAAYNAGENAVIKYGNKVPPYTETVDYVSKVLTAYNDLKKS